MKNRLMVILLLLLSIGLFGQTSENARICGDFRGIAYLYHGVPFLSLEIQDWESYQLYKQTKIHYCNQVRKTFFVNGLSLSEDSFVKLTLKKKDIDLDNCYYTEDYCGDSISQINFFAHVKIPIVIDGFEYSYGDTLPLKELQGKKLRFVKERRFLRKNRILVKAE